MNLNQVKIFIFQTAEKCFGEDFVRTQYRKTATILFKKNKVVFIHIPKSGGTSVAGNLFGKRAGHSTAVEFRDMLGIDNFNEIFSFAVVRNPYDRVVSAYHYARQGGGSEGGIRKLPAYKSVAFASFESFVKNWLVLQDPLKTELIFKPQYLFVCDKNQNIIVNWIGKIENPGEIEATILQKIGRSITIDKRNISKRKKFSEYYTPELEDLVFKFYERDFELFGYNR